MGPTKASAVWIFAIVSLQVAVAIGLSLYSAPWWSYLLVSYTVGAFCNHALFVMIHEASHNLVFQKSWQNKLIGIFANIPIAVPSAISFRNYHMLHHHYLGNYDYDADVPAHGEAKWVGNSSWKKALWMVFFGFVQGAIRPARLPKVKKYDRWVVANILFETTLMVAFALVFGPMTVLYFFLSTFFGLGLHPLGGRWIQEHYIVRPGQETYSYYGPLNKLTFNMGYHNEHHDLMMVPWNNLPKLKAMAPEYYDHLYAHKSWSKLVWRFIFDKNLSPYSRIVHTKNSTIRNKKGETVHQSGLVDGEHVFQTDSQLIAEQADSTQITH